MYSRAVLRSIHASTILKLPQSVKPKRAKTCYLSRIPIPSRFILEGGNAVLYSFLVMEMNGAPQSTSRPPKLLDQVRAQIRLRH